VYVDVNSIFGLLCVVDVGSVAGASEVHVSSIVRIEVSEVVHFFVYIDPVSKKSIEGGPSSGPKETEDQESHAAALLRTTDCIRKITGGN
jgi:hypothetical protein